MKVADIRVPTYNLPVPERTRGCVFLDKHGVLDLERRPRAPSRNDAARFLWALNETVGRKGWRLAILSRAGGYRAAQTIVWLAGMRALHHLSEIVFTSYRTSG